MIKEYNLRQLIDRLEILSKGGRNDDMPVRVVNEETDIDEPVTGAYIDTFATSNEECDFIRIEL